MPQCMWHPSGPEDDRYRTAFKLLLDLADTNHVPVKTIRSSTDGLTLVHDTARFYEQCLLRVDQHLHERAELEEALQISLYNEDELSSTLQRQDKHVQTLRDRIHELESENCELSQRRKHSRNTNMNWRPPLRSATSSCTRH